MLRYTHYLAEEFTPFENCHPGKVYSEIIEYSPLDEVASYPLFARFSCLVSIEPNITFI